MGKFLTMLAYFTFEKNSLRSYQFSHQHLRWEGDHQNVPPPKTGKMVVEKWGWPPVVIFGKQYQKFQKSQCKTRRKNQFSIRILSKNLQNFLVISEVFLIFRLNAEEFAGVFLDFIWLIEYQHQLSLYSKPLASCSRFVANCINIIQIFQVVP